MPIAIVVHGGAGTVDPSRAEAVQVGCRAAAQVGWQVLEHDGSALDAVEAAVRNLEDNPQFNAGTGSCLSTEGHIEMDAGLMEGHTLRVGAVAAVELIKNPIVLARKVLDSPHVLLSCRGAQQFAIEHGMALCTHEDLLTERQQLNWQRARTAQDEHTSQKHGTVGAVALDQTGFLAAATSTGGITNKYPGRIGDSPLPGCGFYADDNAAISCTGQGEDFMRLLIAKRTADLVAHGANARAAGEATIAFLGAKAQGSGGLIIVDRLGNIGFTWNTQNLAYAYLRSGMQQPVTGI